MKKIAILFGVASIFASCNTTSENTMRINANLEGMEDQVVYLSNSRKLEPIDSCEMKDGKFSFDVKFDMPNVKYLFIKQKTRRGDNYSSTMIFVEPGTLNIAGVRDESGLYKAQMSGTISNELWQEVSKINYTECTLKERPIREKLSEASARLNKANNEKLKNEIQAEINDLKAQLNKIYLDSDKLINELVNKNISTFFAAFYIMDSNYELRNSIEKSDSILKVFEAAGMPNNQAVETIKSRLEILKKTAPGMPAIDFTLKTIGKITKTPKISRRTEIIKI